MPALPARVFLSEAVVTNEASYDFHCPAKNISVQVIKSDGGKFMYGKKLVVFNAQGCGKQQIYDSIGRSVYKSMDGN